MRTPGRAALGALGDGEVPGHVVAALGAVGFVPGGANNGEFFQIEIAAESDKSN